MAKAVFEDIEFFSDSSKKDTIEIKEASKRCENNIRFLSKNCKYDF